MAARKRYIAKGIIQFNDVDVAGQRFILMGKCTVSGTMSNAKPKPLKKDLTSVVLRMEDKKWMKVNGLKGFYENVMSNKSFEKFFEEVT